MQSAQIEKNRLGYTNCIRLLDRALTGIRELSSPYYLKYHNACATMDMVAETLVAMGVPMGQIIPPIMNLMNMMPAQP
jgi:hypothetical protein